MPAVLIATDGPDVVAAVQSVLQGSDSVRVVTTGAAVRVAVSEQTPDLVVLDFQIGSMGGVAACLDLRLEQSGGRLPHVPVLLLLDRRADVFLARRAGAEGWVVKPLDPMRLRQALRRVMGGGTYEDSSYVPNPRVPVVS